MEDQLVVLIRKAKLLGGLWAWTSKPAVQATESVSSPCLTSCSKPTPRSEHLFTVLETLADSTLYIGADSEELFDRAEIMMAIEVSHIEHPEPVGQDETLWAPIGRFGWKRPPSSPLDRMVAEAVGAGDNWKPARAGLFGSSSTRFTQLAQGISRRLSNVAW
jgi:hypothetical protein